MHGLDLQLVAAFLSRDPLGPPPPFSGRSVYNGDDAKQRAY